MEYGRHQDAGQWFKTTSVGVLGAMMLTVATTAAVAYYQYTQAPILQRLYLPMYIKSTVASSIGLSTARYPLAAVRYSDGREFLEIDPTVPQRFSHHDIAAWCQGAIYEGRAISSLLIRPACAGLGVGAVGLLAGLIVDAKRRRERRLGRWLRGTRSVHPSEFTRLAEKRERYT